MTASLRRTVCALATAAAMVVGTPAAAGPVSIRTLAAEQVHLATIAYRVSTASARYCSRPEMLTGMVTHDLTQYDPALRPAISSAFSLHSGFGVVGIVPGSTAAEAGLQIDDEILQVGATSVEDPAAMTTSKKSYKRIDWMAAVMQSALEQSGSTELLVRRNGQVIRLPLRAERGCGGRFALANSSELNAWSDGAHVVVTTKMAAMAQDDDEIAFVIAHEMAHNILHHSSATSERHGIFGSLTDARRSEIEADTLAVTLESRAGYHPTGGVAFLQRAQRQLWWAALSLDHPSFGRRLQAVRAAMAALPLPSVRTAQAEPPVERAETLAKAAYEPAFSTRTFRLSETSVPRLFAFRASRAIATRCEY